MEESGIGVSEIGLLLRKIEEFHVEISSIHTKGRG